MGDKENVMFKICNAVLQLEIEKGHLCWKVSDIAKLADVTRSLIYYYFGKEKDTIFEEAYRFMINIILPEKNEAKSGIAERTKKAIRLFEKVPYIFIIYFMEKDKDDSPIGKIIRNAESRILERFKESNPHLSDKEILQAFTMQLGAIACKLPIEKVDLLFSAFDRNKIPAAH